MWNGSGWYGFIGTISTSTTDISLLLGFMQKTTIGHSFKTLCLLVSSADDLCKQFGPISGPTKRQALSGSKLFDTLMVHVLMNECFEKNEEKSADDKNSCNITK